jgi:hypothetical protein
MKMLGRLGWRGQCGCCNGPRGKHSIKQEEARQWHKDVLDELADDREESSQTLWIPPEET